MQSKYPQIVSYDTHAPPVARHDHTKHLGLYLDSALNFSKHVKEAVLVALKGISLKYLSKYVDKNVLNLYYKLYVRPHLDYGDVIYHKQRADLIYNTRLPKELVERDYMMSLTGSPRVTGGGLAR